MRRAIESGQIVGPRYYPSGAFLGTRGGHADFGTFTNPPGSPTNFSRLNMAQEISGVDEVYLYGRNNMRMGATQLKFMISGGVISAFDPWQLLAGSEEEIGAAVQVANEYGTYVMSHAYRKEAILNACFREPIKNRPAESVRDVVVEFAILDRRRRIVDD